MSRSDAEASALNVSLAGRSYPLRVAPGDEEAIRRIGKELNAKVVEFQKAYTGKDPQDCLAMLLLIYAVDLYKVNGDDDGGPSAGSLPEDALDTIAQLRAEVTQALEESAAEGEPEGTAAS